MAQGRGFAPPVFFSNPFFSFSARKKRTVSNCQEKKEDAQNRKCIPCRHRVRRSQLHSVSAGAAKTPYPLAPSSFPKADRCAGSPFGSNKKRKETTREPFGWFSGLSIDQSLALDLRRMEVGESTIDFVGTDAERICNAPSSRTAALGIAPYRHERSAAGWRDENCGGKLKKGLAISGRFRYNVKALRGKAR